MSKVALVIGHSKKKKGASNKSLNINEFELNEKLVNDIHEKCDNSIVIYRDTLAELPNKINQENPDYIISFHCNAFNGNVSGTETLYWHKSKNGKTLAQKFQDSMLKVLKLNDRGLVSVKYHDRGWYILRKTNAPCIIVEPFFIDNNSDVNTFKNNREEYINELSSIINNL